MPREITDFICEYKTMFEDVAKSSLRTMKPADDVMYSSMDYAKCLTEMCSFLEGYIEYREKGETKYDSSLLQTTKNFYDGMFADTSDKSPYRHQTTLVDMKHVNESFLEGTQKLIAVMESVTEQFPDHETQQLVTMSKNQYQKLARVYKDDASLYMWLTTKNSVNPKVTPAQNRAYFYDPKTPVMHRLDQYSK